jgi:hypothetical protein
MEITTENAVWLGIFGLMLLGGLVVGALAYTGRWRSWHYDGTILGGIAPPLTIFWYAVAGLIIYIGLLFAIAGIWPIFIGSVVLGAPLVFFGLISRWWFPRPLLPRWMKEEDARLAAKHGKARR